MKLAIEQSLCHGKQVFSNKCMHICSFNKSIKELNGAGDDNNDFLFHFPTSLMILL